MSPSAQQGLRRWPRRAVAVGAVVAMVATTVALALWIVSVKSTPPEAPPAVVKRVPVEVVIVQPETFTHHITALGTVKPLREASVASQAEGPIVAIPEGVELGAHLGKGQLVAQIKRTSYEIARREAEALLAQRRAAYEEQRRDSEKRAVLFKIAEESVALVKAEADRMEALYNEGVVSKSENDTSRERLTQARSEYERRRSEYRSADAALSRVAAEIAQAEARLARAKEDLANTRITAPFAGLIAEKVADVGDHVAVGQTIVRL
ncbi:MAG: efflux RND transporter periplasmic adaptor subunit, partial [Candidatus Tectimicrobiota bacterium]